MTPRMRKSILYGALLATGLAALLAPPEEQAVQPVRDNDMAVNRITARAETPPAQVTSAMALTPKKRTALSALPKDLFHIETPPPVFADTETAQAPPPVAPPLPYVYMGKSIGQDQITVFLTRDEKPYVAQLGDILDDQYRVDAINPPLLEFTYLPLAQKQMLDIGVAR